jgi:hypothetical protein
MRVALAAALFVNPDLLLLDEPTNHLDFPAVLWLEDYLQTYQKTLVVVSHDRNFVNSVITDVIHFHNQSLTFYRGDYETFERVRLDQQKTQKKAVAAQEKQRAHVQAFIDRFRYNANRAALVQSRIKSLARMELMEDVVDDPKCASLCQFVSPFFFLLLLFLFVRRRRRRCRLRACIIRGLDVYIAVPCLRGFFKEEKKKKRVHNEFSPIFPSSPRNQNIPPQVHLYLS